MTAPVLGRAMRRARKDPVGRLLATAAAAGVRFRIAGAVLQVGGAGGLHPADQELLGRHLPDIRARLEPPASAVDLLDLLDVDVEVITDEARARAVIAGLGDGALGFDIETAPLPGNGAARPWIRITKAGHPAAHQDRDADKVGLDPFRAAPRLAQLYDPVAATVFILDLARLPIDVLHGLEDRRLYVHNADFEHVMLRAQGIRLRATACTLQMAQVVFGAERGGLRLADVARTLLDLDVSKEEQASDWGADRLSANQLVYAGTDAVLAQRIAGPLWAALDRPARRAFKLANATIPVVSDMRLAGVPFDRTTHAATIAAWERDYAAARDQFTALTGGPIPAAGPQRSAWLTAHMPTDMLEWWPRTATGQLGTAAANLERLAAVPEVRPLLEVLHWDKRLRAFGNTLLELVGPDRRLHMELRAARTKTGRCSCSRPNIQQMPQDVRRAVVAPAGRTFVIGDYQQAELRAAAELSGDEAMRQVFRDGQDMHRLNAEAFVGVDLDTLPPAEQEVARGKAKRIGFGTLYGSGPGGLVASAWSMYRIEMTEAEARAYREAFYARYPRLRQWQNETARAAEATGVLRSAVGRPLRAEWEAPRGLRWTLCCNFPVQSSTADAMMVAMARVHAVLEGRDAQLILQVHDELVVECAEHEGPAVEALLVEHMTAAWLELFPDAPVNGLVDVATRQCWAKPRKS
jgi:DNA polymerase-1